MKTRVLKLILPLFALLLAVGFAFATEESSAYQTAYYEHPILGLQQTTTSCPDNGNKTCMEGSFVLYSDPGLTQVIKRP